MLPASHPCKYRILVFTESVSIPLIGSHGYQKKSWREAPEFYDIVVMKLNTYWYFQSSYESNRFLCWRMKANNGRVFSL
jgi:hypothetical protein